MNASTQGTNVYAGPTATETQISLNQRWNHIFTLQETNNVHQNGF